MNKLSVSQLKELYIDGDHKELTIKLPHNRRKGHFITNLLNSNILTMGSKILGPPLTFGADPEFILEDDNGGVLLFSNEHVTSNFGMSEAEVGADYGLLEFRVPPVDNPLSIIKSIKTLYKKFNDTVKGASIKNTEAIVYNHRLNRIRKGIESGIEYDYGGTGKDQGVWNNINNECDPIIGLESTQTFSAYDFPRFPKYREDILTAGGHIHIGGTFIQLLSFEQLRLFVRILDEKILPICIGCETSAGELRREAYGFPGEFRIKNYGIEYRSPSNAIFQKHNLGKLKKVYKIIEKIARNFLVTLD